jgi:hypothetical protein
MDNVREQRTGISKQSMGLDADALQSTTATAVAAMQAASQGKIEMIARVFAETGVRRLFRGILHLVTKYQNKDKIVRLRNEFVTMSPREWDNMYDVQINVGLGTSQKTEQMQFLMATAQKQEQIITQMGPDNPLVSLTQYRNTLAKISELAGFKDSEQFYASAQEVDMKVQMAAQQKMQQGQQQNPLVAIEQQKFQAEMQMKQAQFQAEQEMKIRQMEMDFQLKREKAEAELQLRRDEIAMEAELRAIEKQAGATISTNLPRG